MNPSQPQATEYIQNTMPPGVLCRMGGVGGWMSEVAWVWGSGWQMVVWCTLPLAFCTRPYGVLHPSCAAPALTCISELTSGVKCSQCTLFALQVLILQCCLKYWHPQARAPPGEDRAPYHIRMQSSVREGWHRVSGFCL